MGLKQNVLYSAILTSANYIFQFITYPYVARVLAPDGIGLYNYVNSIVQFFMLFSAMGVINLGTRQIAKCSNRTQLDETFSKILAVNGVITVWVVAAYVSMILIVPEFYLIRKYLFVGVFQIVFNAFTLEWLFRGVENFKFITTRSVIIRALYVVAVFLFVKTEDDVFLYYAMSTLIYVFNGVINWLFSRKMVSLVSVSVKRSCKEYLKPMILLGSQALISFFYVGFNTVFLGMVSGDYQVGLLSTATKIIMIMLALFTAFSTAILPRISAITANGNKNSISEIIKTSIEIVLFFSVPLIIILFCFSEQIVLIIGGQAYMASALLLKISSFLIVIIGLNQIMLVQVLIPNDKEERVSLCCAFGAVFGVGLNIVLVGVLKMQALGSIVIWLVAETIVLIAAAFFSRHYLDLSSVLYRPLLRVLYYMPLVFILLIVNEFCLNIWWGMSIGCMITILYTHVLVFSIFKQQQYRSMVLTLLRLH